ncbi:hypothetical protein ACHAO8_002575 [Botrytis cinerea]
MLSSVLQPPVDKHWFWLLAKRLGTWEQAPESLEEKKAVLRLACEFPRANRFWRQRARIAGDDKEFDFTQNDFVNADRSTLAIFPNQPVVNEAEQARLFGESRERTSLGGVSGGESGENVDADGDVAVG